MWNVQRILWWLETASVAANSVSRVVGFLSLGPNVSFWLAPLAAVASVVSLAVLAGLAVGALTTLLLTLLALSYILSEVLGISVEWRIPVERSVAF